MGDLSALASRHVGTLLSFLERGIVTRGDAHEFLALWARANGAAAASVAQGHGFFPWVCVHGVTNRWMDTHRRHQAEDPSGPALLRAGPGSTYRVHADGTREQREMPLFRALATHGYSDAAITTIASSFGAPLFSALYRDDGRTFGAEDGTLLRLLHPHVARAFGPRLALDAIAESAPETLSDAKRRAQGYARVIDGEVVLSAGAHELFFGEMGTPLTPRALGRALRGALERSRAMRGPRTFRLGRVRVDHVDVGARAGAPGYTLLLFHDERGVRLAPAAELLTHTQRRVVLELARGVTLEAAARALGVSRETVRTHLRAACARMGVGSRQALIAATVLGA